MTAKEKVCILKNITDNELLVKRINDYAMRFMREEKIYDYFFSCPIYGMDGELIDLEFRRKESGDLVYCGYNLKIYLQTNGELIFEQECGICIFRELGYALPRRISHAKGLSFFDSSHKDLK